MRKRFVHIVLTVLLSVFAQTMTAQPFTYSDSVEISLLTCSPGREIWAEYGHTAIRYNDLHNHQDYTVNYGVFSESQPYFIPRFVFGLTDYSMGIVPTDLFIEQYSYENRLVTEQKLNLTAADKLAICKALQENMKPENVVYRYNFFYDNCTSRARDIILGHLHGKVTFPPADNKATFRSMIHEWNGNGSWTQLGEDILLGINADRKTTKAEQQFLPDNLRKDFERAVYNGRPLVSTTKTLNIKSPMVEDERGFPLTPMEAAILFAIIATTILLVEYKTRKLLWGWDLLLMLASGTIGVVLFTMIFSQHPCVSLNMIIFIFNPLALVFARRTIRSECRREKGHWWLLWEISLFIGFIGGFFQHIPLPVLIVALFLLLNCVMHQWIDRHHTTNIPTM